MIQPPTKVEIYLSNSNGRRLAVLDTVNSYQYKKVTNSLSPFNIRLPGTFDRNLIALDNIIEFWRGFEDSELTLDYTGFLRGWGFGDSKGLEYTRLYGNSLNDLLRRRVVLYYAGSSQAGKNLAAGDMIKSVFNDNYLAGAPTDRRITNNAGGVSYDASHGDGVTLDKAFSYKNVLEVVQSIANSSAQAGTREYFDIKATETGLLGYLALKLYTYPNYQGNDRTIASHPVYVGTQWGNFENGYLDFDYTEEINFVRALGAGEGLAREYVDVSNTAQIGVSIWNRCEGVVDCRDVDPGDTDKLTGEANAVLQENKPRLSLSGDIIETETFRYNRDWFWGDKVIIAYAGYETPALIDEVTLNKDETGKDTITSKYRLTS